MHSPVPETTSAMRSTRSPIRLMTTCWKTPKCRTTMRSARRSTSAAGLPRQRRVSTLADLADLAVRVPMLVAVQRSTSVLQPAATVTAATVQAETPTATLTAVLAVAAMQRPETAAAAQRPQARPMARMPTADAVKAHPAAQAVQVSVLASASVSALEQDLPQAVQVLPVAMQAALMAAMAATAATPMAAMPTMPAMAVTRSPWASA